MASTRFVAAVRDLERYYVVYGERKRAVWSLTTVRVMQ